MEELLEKYLMDFEDNKYIKVISYTIYGAECSVDFSTSKNRKSKAMTIINIWSMIEFIYRN